MILKGDKNIKMIQRQNSLEVIANPNLQVARTKQKLYEVLKCVNEDLSLVTNRKARTLLETTVALVQGLIKAYEHYEYCWKQKNKRKNFN